MARRSARAADPVEGIRSPKFSTAGTFADGQIASGVKLGEDQDLIVTSSSTTKRTLTATLRNGGGSLPNLGISQGGTRIFPGLVFDKVACSAADAGVAWAAIPAGLADQLGSKDAMPRNADGSLVVGGVSNGIAQIFGGGGNPVLVAVDPTDLTLIEDEFLAPTALATTAEAVQVAGTTVIPVGSLVRASLLAAVPSITTAGDILIYIAIKGHTSNTYYAVGTAGSSFHSFRIAQSEKLDIVARNQDTTAKQVSAHWQSFQGDM